MKRMLPFGSQPAALASMVFPSNRDTTAIPRNNVCTFFMQHLDDREIVVRYSTPSRSVCAYSGGHDFQTIHASFHTRCRNNCRYHPRRRWQDDAGDAPEYVRRRGVPEVA